MHLIWTDPWCSVSNLVLSKQCLICIGILDHLSYKWGNKYFSNHSKILLFIRQIARAYSLNFPQTPKILIFPMTFLVRACAQHNGILWEVRNESKISGNASKLLFYFFYCFIKTIHLNVQNSNDYSLTFKNYLYFCEQYLREPGLLCTWKILDLYIQLMKNGNKTRNVAFIFLFSVL